MSYYTDLDNDRGADYESAVEQMEDDIAEEQWRTRDGKVVPIKGMKTSHIRNTIRLITRNMDVYEDESERYAENRRIQREQLEEELERRKKCAAQRQKSEGIEEEE